MMTGQESCVLWLKDIRPARNWIEQNVVILPEKGRLQSPSSEVSPSSLCERHGSQNPGVHQLRFVALIDIFRGSELLAWPDLLFGLTIGVPYLAPQHVKSNVMLDSLLKC